MKLTKSKLKQIIKEELTDHWDNRDKIAMSKMAADSATASRGAPQSVVGGGVVVHISEDTVYLQPSGNNIIFNFNIITAENNKQTVSATLHPDSVQALKDEGTLK